MKRSILATALLALAAAAPGQTFTVLHSFTGGTDGYRPESALALSGSTLYSTTLYGSTVFKINTDGTGFAVLRSTATPSWVQPNGVIVSGRTLFGTTGGGD